MGDIIIEETNYKLFILTLANLFMMIASIAVWILGVVKAKSLYYIPGVFSSFLFLTGFVIAVSKALKVKRLLTISRDGITDHSTIGSIGFVSYDDIKEFEIVNYLGTRSIGIIPKDQDNFIKKLSPMKQRTARGNVNAQLPPISINVNMAKDMTLEDIYTLLKKRLSDYSSLYD